MERTTKLQIYFILYFYLSLEIMISVKFTGTAQLQSVLCWKIVKQKEKREIVSCILIKLVYINSEENFLNANSYDKKKFQLSAGKLSMRIFLNLLSDWLYMFERLNNFRWNLLLTEKNSMLVILKLSSHLFFQR